MAVRDYDEYSESCGRDEMYHDGNPNPAAKGNVSGFVTKCGHGSKRTWPAAPEGEGNQELFCRPTICVR
jgi:hypothetical protein